MTKPELRANGRVELRAATDGVPRTIVGYAAVFDSPTDIGGYFIEKIARGAFTGAIARPDDVRCLFNHRDSAVLGRTKSGTLSLFEDEIGLRYEVTPPNATWAHDLVASIERGDVSQSSFQFRAKRQSWDETGDVPVRTLLEVELIDVSPVTFPAYDDTEVGLRSKEMLDAFRARQLASPATVARARMQAGLHDRIHFSRLG